MNKELNTYGITHTSYNQLMEQISMFSEIEEVKLFGSRAIGNYNCGSDIDLCLLGENITSNTLFKLRYNIDEYTIIPYSIDFIIWDQIKSKELLEHINNIGISIYNKDSL